MMDLTALKDHLDLMGLLDKTVTSASQDLKEHLASPEEKVHLVKRVSVAQVDRPEDLDLKDNSEKLVTADLQAHRDRKEKRVTMDCLAHEDPLEIKDHSVSEDYRETTVMMETTEHQEHLDWPESLETLDNQEKGVHKALVVLPAIRAPLVRRETPDRQEAGESRVQRANEEHRASLERREPADLPEPKVPEAYLELLEELDLRVQGVQKVLQAHREIKVLWESLALEAQLDRQESLVHQVKMVCQDSPERQETMACQGEMELVVLQE